MITSANFVTYPGEKRLQALEFAVASIRQQVDIVRICWNNYTSIPPGFDFALNKIPIEDLTDNGKFYFVPFANEDMYLTCDDDILYPEDYDVVIAKAPSIVASYAEDIMQCGSYYPAAVVSNTTGEGIMARQCSLELDIRVKRRVTQATQIILSTGHETTTGFETQLVGAEEATFRCLIKLA